MVGSFEPTICFQFISIVSPGQISSIISSFMAKFIGQLGGLLYPILTVMSFFIPLLTQYLTYDNNTLNETITSLLERISTIVSTASVFVLTEKPVLTLNCSIISLNLAAIWGSSVRDESSSCGTIGFLELDDSFFILSSMVILFVSFHQF